MYHKEVGEGRQPLRRLQPLRISPQRPHDAPVNRGGDPPVEGDKFIEVISNYRILRHPIVEQLEMAQDGSGGKVYNFTHHYVNDQNSAVSILQLMSFCVKFSNSHTSVQKGVFPSCSMEAGHSLGSALIRRHVSITSRKRGCSGSVDGTYWN